MSKIAQLFKKKPKADESEIPAYSPPQHDTRIKIIHSCRGSSDGIHTKFFQANQIVNVSAELARLLVDELKAAERI